MLIPIIWNPRTNRVVGGHQRLSVEEHLGRAEVDVSVVDLDETREKELNLILNKAQGAWDDVKLQELLNNLSETERRKPDSHCRRSPRCRAASKTRWTKPFLRRS